QDRLHPGAPLPGRQACLIQLDVRPALDARAARPHPSVGAHRVNTPSESSLESRLTDPQRSGMVFCDKVRSLPSRRTFRGYTIKLGIARSVFPACCPGDYCLVPPGCKSIDMPEPRCKAP